MGDGGIIVITLTGGEGDHERLDQITANFGKADVLEVRAKGALAPEMLARISKLAATNDVALRFKDVRSEV